MKRCPNCGACQECGHAPAFPWWGVIPPYVQPTYPTYPGTFPNTAANPATITWYQNTSGAALQ